MRRPGPRIACLIGIMPELAGVPLGAAVLPPQRDTLILGTASVGLELRY